LIDYGILILPSSRSRASGNGEPAHGDTGVQLTFKQGKPLLIGSQRPEQLAAVINKYLSQPASD